MGWKSLKEIYLEEKKIPFFVRCEGKGKTFMISEVGRSHDECWRFEDSDQNSLNPYSEVWEKVDVNYYKFGNNITPITWGEPPPTKGGQVVYTELIKDIESRAEFGRQKYGQDLMTRDGRNTIKDAYEEALDLLMYLKKLMMEQEND